MIKTIKQTISNLYYWIKKKLVQFKKWIIVIIFGAVILAASPQLPDIALENIQADYNASSIQNKYRLEKTAFILDAIDENAIQAEVGNKNLDKFTPELTLRKWDDEVNFKVKYKHSEKEKDQKVDIENEKIKWKGNETEVHYYDIKKGELLHDKVLESDVYEVEVVLLEKPDTNIVEFDIETKGLAFYYQPELMQEEIDEGAERPENIIGSYAVYHESKQGDYSPMGLKNYRAGKAFHIYRPKIIDSAGTEVWGNLNIENNLLTVTIPQDFLDNAVYPVRHASGLTFGFTSIGGSNADIEGIYITDKGTPSSSGTVDKISTYLGIATGNHKVVCGIYDNSKNLLTNGQSNEVDHPAGTGWVDNTYTTKPSVVGSTIYSILAAVEATDGTAVFYYDILGGANSSSYTTRNYDGNVPDSIGTLNYDMNVSIYATYTAGGGAERRMFITQ